MAPDKPGVPDGLKVDLEGNLFATGPGGVWVIRSRRHAPRHDRNRGQDRQLRLGRRRVDALHHGGQDAVSNQDRHQREAPVTYNSLELMVDAVLSPDSPTRGHPTAHSPARRAAPSGATRFGASTQASDGVSNGLPTPESREVGPPLMDGAMLRHSPLRHEPVTPTACAAAFALASAVPGHGQAPSPSAPAGSTIPRARVPPPKALRRVLVVGAALGWQHESIPDGMAMVWNLGDESGCGVEPRPYGLPTRERRTKQTRRRCASSSTVMPLDADQKRHLLSSCTTMGRDVARGARRQHQWPDTPRRLLVRRTRGTFEPRRETASSPRRVIPRGEEPAAAVTRLTRGRRRSGEQPERPNQRESHHNLRPPCLPRGVAWSEPREGRRSSTGRGPRRRTVDPDVKR